MVLRSNPAVFGIASESFEWDFKVSDKSILAAWMAAFEKGIGGGAGEEEGERGSRVSVSVPRGSGSGIKEGKKEEEEGELKREGGGGKYQKMLEALTKEGEGGRRMRECLVESLEKKEQKEVGEMLVHACEALGAGVAGRVLGELVRIEIERCNKPNTLFRGNNFAEKVRGGKRVDGWVGRIHFCIDFCLFLLLGFDFLLCHCGVKIFGNSFETFVYVCHSLRFFFLSFSLPLSFPFLKLTQQPIY